MSENQLHACPARRGPRPGVLVVLSVVLAGLTALIVSTVAWQRRERVAVEQLAEEAHRLGGDACIEQAGLDSWERTIDLVVDLHGSGVDDEGFARLERMPAFRHIRFLRLADTQITDRSLRLLEKHDRLIFLDVSRTKVTDAGLEALANLPALGVLRLSGTAVSDRGLAVLARRSGSMGLRQLDLTDTGVTEDGVRVLTKAFEHDMLVIEHPAAVHPVSNKR